MWFAVPFLSSVFDGFICTFNYTASTKSNEKCKLYKKGKFYPFRLEHFANQMKNSASNAIINSNTTNWMYDLVFLPSRPKDDNTKKEETISFGSFKMNWKYIQNVWRRELAMGRRKSEGPIIIFSDALEWFFNEINANPASLASFFSIHNKIIWFLRPVKSIWWKLNFNFQSRF